MTGADGQKLGATIVPAQDGSYAWLFFDDPMPGGATITLQLNGNMIRAAADGAQLWRTDLPGDPGNAVGRSFARRPGGACGPSPVPTTPAGCSP